MVFREASELMAHDWTKPHNHRGDGRMTKCPEDCPGYEVWKAKQEAE